MGYSVILTLRIKKNLHIELATVLAMKAYGSVEVRV